MPGSTNPCEIAEFCGRHVENNIFFDVCYFSVFFAYLGAYFPKFGCVSAVEVLRRGCLVKFYTLEGFFTNFSAPCSSTTETLKVCGFRATLPSFRIRLSMNFDQQGNFVVYFINSN